MRLAVKLLAVILVLAPAAATCGNAAAPLAALTAEHGGQPFLSGGVLVVEGDRVLLDYAHGTGASSRVPRTDPVFQAASMSKPFTAVAVLQLRDRGLLTLDDPVAKHLPGFPYPGMSLRHLLGHTSALPDLELFESLIAADPGRIVTPEDLLPALHAWTAPLAFTPGERFRYSNVNYQLLALVVARVSGRSFADYMAKDVFTPAGMASTWVLGGRRPPGASAPVANLILPTMFTTVPQDVREVRTGDERQMRRLRYETVNLGSTVGDQNVFTTLADLRRFDVALRRGTLLSLASQEEAYRPVRLNDGSAYMETEPYQPYGTPCSYGLGWEVCDHPRFGRVVGHAGYNHGIATQLWRNPARAQLVAMFDNADGSEFGLKVAAVTAVLNGQAPPALTWTRSLTRVYGAELVASGPVAALVLYNRLKSDSAWASTAAGMNRLGYDLMRNGKHELAMYPFALNVVLEPANAGWYDSLGEGLAANGRIAEAIVAYRRSLELQPDNASGREALRRLESQ